MHQVFGGGEAWNDDIELLHRNRDWILGIIVERKNLTLLQERYSREFVRKIRV